MVARRRSTSIVLQAAEYVESIRDAGIAPCLHYHGRNYDLLCRYRNEVCVASFDMFYHSAVRIMGLVAMMTLALDVGVS